MSKRTGRARPHPKPKTRLHSAISAIALGLVMVLASLFSSSVPALKGISSGLRFAGLLALALGAMLLFLQTIVKHRNQDKTPPVEDWRHKTDPGDAPSPSSATNATPAVPTPCSVWSEQVFADIEWRRFEAVCELLFSQAGFITQSQSHGADGGVDIWLHSRHTQGPAAIVQCKHWNGKRVGVKELREFYGVMASHNIQHGTYATTSTYSSDAVQFAKANQINALDGNRLLALIAKRTPEQQQALLKVAYEGEYWRPTCANCGIKMIYRPPSKGSAAFWGCSNFPRCKSILRIARA